MDWKYLITNEFIWLGLGLIGLAVGLQIIEWFSRGD